jgi:two-component system, NtrC family, response regulator GlrR
VLNLQKINEGKMKLPQILSIYFNEETENETGKITKLLENEFEFTEMSYDSDISEYLFVNEPDICILSFAKLRNEVEKNVKFIAERFPQILILIYSQNITSAVTKKLSAVGANGFISQTDKKSDILHKIKSLIKQKNGQNSVVKELGKKHILRKIIGKSPLFTAELEKLPIYAECDVCVLIVGETGTGKELIARSLHYLSPRTNKPFVPVNCGAIPVDLIENELFGHEKGAYTSAAFSQKGLIQEANGGTLFLDEIDSLPLNSQVKLLRFLQDKEYRLLGSTKLHKADIRIIAASNSNLEQLSAEGKFRLDLYYRLNVMQIFLPPLKDRIDDILPLANHFSAKYSKEFNKPLYEIEPAAIQKLQFHDWKGNVRELENVIERAVLLTKNDKILASDIFLGQTKKESFQETFQTAKAKVVEKFEKSYIRQILTNCNGNISQAAKAAGKDRRAFFELIKKYQINVDKFRLQK